MSRQLVLENMQAPGDSLMFTCAVRDLHRQFPNEFTTQITTRCRDIWLNNPHAKSLDRNSKSLQYRIGYSSSINSSNQRNAHFASGFVQDLSEKMGTRIRLTDMRPDIHLTDAEELNRPVKEPYWVMIAGGKRDFTTKLWAPESYQGVVDRLAGQVKFVQVGAAGHNHPKLDNVDYKVGKTSLRQFIHLVRHSEGVVCPITCGMHLAAAFNKPAVVIAGGREPWWWEAYTRNTWAVNVPQVKCPDDFVDHTYLHTMGDFNCCLQQACWRNGVGEHKNKAKNCKQVTRRASIPQAGCMASITPDIVTEAIKVYLDGGTPVLDTIPIKLRPPLFKEPLPKAAKPIMLSDARKPRVKISRGRRGRGHVSRRRFLKPGSPTRTHVRKPNLAPHPASPHATHLDTTQAPMKALTVHAGRATKDMGAVTPVTICVVLYGDYPALAQRCLESIYSAVDPRLFELRIGLNAVSERTRRMVDKYIVPQGNVTLYDEPKNIYKYPMLRKMFHDDPITTEWIVYFDDDSHITEGDWLIRLNQAVNKHPKAGMFGKKYFYHLNTGQVAWYKAAEWYKGKQLQLRNGVPKVDFLTGGYWAVKTEHIVTTNWPDPRLSNNGGDVAMGEALRQNDIPMRQYYYGVKISDHARRGASQKHPGR